LQSQAKEGTTVVSSKRKPVLREDFDPSKKYLSCTIVKGSAFADFVNVRSDESISISASFLKNRFHTKAI